ncbi:class I SAM-dependent methyltransferase [Aquidulcibacter paucihalophilus]|uniref:class I SAM-dependent methyltransferase n=1 Tax=Aquidulcibacter paucihalophilus TaxID=1978549 RepID=UPI000A18B6CD|nr:class I SAM-dependent methyltransferase [Aquidulcibacter paucihalophilus]
MRLDKQAEQRQREYYAAHVDDYEDKHLSNDDEHMRALAMFQGLALGRGHASILDVGAGTGRGIRFLQQVFPASKVIDVEPSRDQREIGHAAGLKPSDLVDGDATRLPFTNNEFDWVIETAVLHHIKDYKAAVSEMCRVARVGVLISDPNNMGQGSFLSRLFKQTLRGLGLWNAFLRLQTGGKIYKFSEGDSVYFSFFAFDPVPILQQKFGRLI